MDSEDLKGTERTKERLRFETEMMRLAVIGLVAIGGGIVSLILNSPSTGTKNFFITLGFILLVFLIVSLYSGYQSINEQ